MSEARSWIDKVNQMNYWEIRDLMILEGIKGVRGSRARCPIANLVRAKDEDLTYVNVGGPYVSWRSGPEDFRIVLRDGPRLFIASFDAGMYAELIEAPPIQPPSLNLSTTTWLHGTEAKAEQANPCAVYAIA